VAHAYNPSYLGGRDQEDQSSKPAWANSSGDPISKNPSQKNRAGRVTQVIEHLLSKHKALSSNSTVAKKTKKRNKAGEMLCWWL
jgi:hypothetical protein